MGYLWRLWPNIRFLPSIVAVKNEHISQASYRYAIMWEAILDPSDSYFLFADLVGFYTHWTYMHIFRHIFLSNYWWQRSDIWSQASYKYQIPVINSCWEKCDEKWAYMFNVYKNQQSRQTGSRNPMGPKTISTIWGTYIHKLHIGTPYREKHFWTHRIPTSCLPTLLIFIHIEHIC
jgi:hypothetical protein